MAHVRVENVGEADTLGQRLGILRAAHVAGAGRGANPNGGFRGRRGRSAGGLHHSGDNYFTTEYGQNATFRILS